MDNSTPSEKAARVPWAAYERAAVDHGGTFYLADLAHFENNCRRFLDAFRRIYPRTSIGYSYKTNYLPHFLERADEIGAYAEVVSRFELDLAERIGVPGPRIIFNGPVKRPADLLHALNIGAKLNIDSISELEHVSRVTRNLSPPKPLGVRCFLGSNTPNSRFGIDVRDRDSTSLLMSLQDSPWLYLAGLHCHHSGNRTVERYKARVQALISVHRDLMRGAPLSYIDVGGGFASPMSDALATQFSEPVPTFDDYAYAVAGEMSSAYGDSGPELILEPGMAILADTMVLVTRVEVLKELNDRQLAVVDASVLNIKPLLGNVNLPISVVPDPSGAKGHRGMWDIVGSTCMEIDTLHKGYAGPLAEGDFIILENVGAYSTVLNAPFIHGTPAVLELDQQGPGKTLRPPTSVADLLATYEFRA